MTAVFVGKLSANMTPARARGESPLQASGDDTLMEHFCRGDETAFEINRLIPLVTVA